MKESNSKSLDWYKSEIKKTYIKLKEAINKEKKALYNYNSLMISTFELGYQCVKTNDKDLKVKYKNCYKALESEFKVVCDSVITRKGYSDYLRSLKDERSKLYDESIAGEQDK